MNPIEGNVYKCTNCSDCCLCENCYSFKDELHTPNHYFIKTTNLKNDDITNKPYSRYGLVNFE